MDFLISSRLDGDKLQVSVTVPDANAYTQYGYYLYHGREVVQREGFGKASEFTFTLSDSGKYTVRVFVRTKESKADPYEKTAKSTRTYTYCSQALREEYRAFVAAPGKEAQIPALPYQKYEYPYQDLLLVYDPSEQSSQTQERICRLAEGLGLLHTFLEPHSLLVSQSGVLEAGERKVAFSGIGRTQDRLVVSMEDVDSPALADEISGQVGTYCLLRADRKQILLETDYFGVDKLYYIHTPEVFLVSNRVHLLVLAMQALHIGRVPNLPKICAYLANTPYTRQNFSQELNIQGMIALRADSRLRIDLASGAIEAEKTDMYYTLCADIPYDAQRYSELVAKACDEIVDNLKIALEHPAFEHYVMHITGGMDSRLVYSALTKLPQYRDKIIVKTARTEKTQEDFRCAVRVISKHRFPQGRIQFDTSRKTDFTDGQLRALSTVLGVTTEVAATTKRLPYYKTCILPGYYGEFLGRLTYSKGLHQTRRGSSTLSDREFYSLLSEVQNRNAIFDVQDELQKTLVKECLALPGKTNLEKIDCHYLYYRNGLHFSSAHRYRPMGPEWGALQSKSQLILKCMIMPLHWGVRLEMDMIRYLDPEIASVEYESESYQEQRKQLNERFGGYPECQEYDEAAIADIVREWETEDAYESTMVERDFPQQENFYEQEKVLEVFRVLMQRLPIPEEAGCAMYAYIKNEAPNVTYTKFLGKLYSLYYELF